MTERLQGKRCIVTGAGSGIGAATARAFIEQGAKLLLTDIAAGQGDSLARQLGDAARFVQHDVSQSADWTRVVESAGTFMGGLDVLVNCAGVIGPRQPFYEVSDAEFERIWRVNEFGVFLGMKAVAPMMRAAGGGSIINLSSAGGLVGHPNALPYVASKFAVTGMSKSAALDLGCYGIRVNSVHPGYIRTPIHTHGLSSDAGKQLVDQIESFSASLPLNRGGEPEDIAKMIVFLASDESGYSTGAAFVADGGLTAS